MKKPIYFIILIFSLSLIFSQGKLCCKNKASKGKISCKLNQANIDINNDGIISDEEANVSDKQIVNCANNAALNSSTQAGCSGCKKAPWWKFWAKKKTCCNTKA